MIDLSNLPALGPPPLMPRDARFAPGPKELAMLAGTFDGQDIGAGWAWEEKHDGIRLLWIDGRILTREGEPMECASHIAPELARLQRRFGEAMMFDGEYVEPGGFHATLGAFKRGQGAGFLHLFDAVPIEAWKAGRYDRPLYQRRLMIRTAMDEWQPRTFGLVESWPLASVEAGRAIVEALWAQGKEGAVLKRSSSPYVRARSPMWLKWKRRLELTGVVLDVLSNGAAVRVAIDGRKHRVAVPPGLRAGLTGSLVGMTARVTAMEWTERGSLRGGSFVRIEGTGQ